MKHKKPRQKFLSIAASPIVEEQLKALIKKTGENRSQVIKRAISEAHEKYCAKKLA